MCLTFSPAESAQGQEAWGPRQAAERASCLEKGKMRGGGTAPPGRKQAENPRFFAKRQAVRFET